MSSSMCAERSSWPWLNLDADLEAVLSRCAPTHELPSLASLDIASRASEFSGHDGSHSLVHHLRYVNPEV